ncbi:MAG: outer membrane lipoprotein carrier protein LolA, partial [Bacilli bacterium]|nr:outer membrane lipoprotein carrier protein LolA [Bacilli bacterium]
IMNNEDTYTYDVKVSYQKEDYYRIELVNTLNNHEQVILRNDDGVYVVTPSLNKSFKFQSDWPYNNSQVYLLNSILEDLLEDEDREFKTKGDGYYFASTVHYPNNKSLVKQKVYIDKDANITKTEVVDSDDNIQIVMEFTKQEYNKKFDKNYFELSELLDINESSTKKETEIEPEDSSDAETTNDSINNSTNQNGTTNNTVTNDSTNTNNNSNTNNATSDSEASSTTEDTTSTEKTASATIDDVIYPMYLPDNTYLTSQNTIDTEDGQRLILTFVGDSSFILVEETVTSSDAGVVIPVSGEFDFLADVIGVIGTNSLSWHSNGIDYYMASESITTAELVEIARSISVLPVSK